MVNARTIIDSISEALEWIPIDESSLSRLLHHNDKRNFGTITASRTGQSKADEHRANASLRKDIHALGYGTVVLKGRYLEDDKHPVHERSFGVIGKEGDDKGELLGHLKSLGEKYKQNSILHKAHNSKDAYLHSTSTKENNNETDLDKEPDRKLNVGPFRPNKPNSYGQSGIGHGKLFSYQK